jgi:hypothetical protein
MTVKEGRGSGDDTRTSHHVAHTGSHLRAYRDGHRESQGPGGHRVVARIPARHHRRDHHRLHVRDTGRSTRCRGRSASTRSRPRRPAAPGISTRRSPASRIRQRSRLKVSNRTPLSRLRFSSRTHSSLLRDHRSSRRASSPSTDTHEPDIKNSRSYNTDTPGAVAGPGALGGPRRAARAAPGDDCCGLRIESYGTADA